MGGGDVKEEGGGGQSASPDPSSTRQQRFRLLQQLEQSSGTMSQSASELETDDHFMGMYEQQMMADFEAMYEEMEPSQSEGEKDGPRAHSDDAEVVVDPRATKVIDLSSTQELVSQVLQDEEGGEAVDERKGERSKDVEEGEVSDSSDERAGGSKKKVRPPLSLSLSLSLFHTHTHANSLLLPLSRHGKPYMYTDHFFCCPIYPLYCHKHKHTLTPTL